VKHENHLPTGAFKVRGGAWMMQQLKNEGITRVVAATRGNHGQSVALAAARHGIEATVVVPHGNNPEKNAAMTAYGAKLITHGADFQEALNHARELSTRDGVHFIESFSFTLVQGVASYGLELLRAVPQLDQVYVPIGLGSGICGVAAARNALGLSTRIIGVVADEAPCYSISLEAGAPITGPLGATIADGVACSTPNAAAFQYIKNNVSRIIRVSEQQIREAMLHLFTDTHNLAEGAGAVALAGAITENDTLGGKRIAVVLTGGNVDRETFSTILQ
jgi:threonine dehydratase